MTEGPRVWGGFYALSVLASNLCLFESNSLDSVLLLLIGMCLVKFTTAIVGRMLSLRLSALASSWCLFESNYRSPKC